MDVRIVASLLNLKISDNKLYREGSISLMNYNENFVMNFMNAHFLNALGMYGRGKVSPDDAFVFAAFSDDIIIIDPANEHEREIASTQSKKYIKSFKHFVVLFDTFLWFAKDNAINVRDILCFSDAGARRGLIPTDYRLIVTNCCGDFPETEYLTTEILSAMSVKDKFFKICPQYTDDDEEYVPKTNNNGDPSGKVLVRDFTTIERAFNFLRAARNSKSLAAKTAMYMSLFESLLTTNSDSITHRVAERMAFYIGKDIKERINIYNKIKDAYGIRSKYVHGLSFNDTTRDKNYRTDILLNIDDYARRLLTKAIMFDSEKFLAKEDDLKQFLEDLVFTSPYAPFEDLTI